MTIQKFQRQKDTVSNKWKIKIQGSQVNYNTTRSEKLKKIKKFHTLGKIQHKNITQKFHTRKI